jgi:hypothetical protein
VASALLPPLRRARRLLPQATSLHVLARLPAVLRLGTAGELLSSGQLPAGKQGIALDFQLDDDAVKKMVPA